MAHSLANKRQLPILYVKHKLLKVYRKSSQINNATSDFLSPVFINQS